MMSSLYTGATGLRAYGEGMASIGHNLANTNTVGFKSAMMLYQDLTSQTVGSASSNGITNMSQQGMGGAVLTNRTMFLQGGFEAGSEPTDMGISGHGYFGVQKDGVLEFTRAGNFRFTKEGDLIDPSGFSLMGNKIVNGVVSGDPTPIKLDLSAKSPESYMPPKATSSITMIENLGSDTNKTNDASNPFFSLAQAWDGTTTPPLASSEYGHHSSIPVYDANGQLQYVDAYFDLAGTFEGKRVYEFVIGTTPDADGSGRAGTAAAGLMAAGTMTFSSTGVLEDMTMFQAPAGASSTMADWAPASFGPDGNPVFAANFAGGGGSQDISLNFGLQLNGTWSNTYASAADAAANPSSLYKGNPREHGADSSTSYIGSSGNVSQNQDGYAEGYLLTLDIQTDGYMTGRYSNGQAEDLYRIPLYRFTSEDGLRREGGNHFSAPGEAGQVEHGFPTTENYGSVNGQQLEQSNVDMAREFTSMVITQRAFQMNSKVVTTSDQMLQKALEIKR